MAELTSQGLCIAAFEPLVTGKQMREIDRVTIDEFGIPGLQLIERAGTRVVETLHARWRGLDGLRVAVVCGKGNNGADGFVVARLLSNAGVAVEVFLGVPRAELGDEAGGLLERFEVAGQVATPLAEDASHAAALGRCDIIVDALLGTGISGAPRTAQAQIIEAMNASQRPIVAVDLPSGVNADSGRVPGAAVRAAVTVSFGVAKVGQLFSPGRGYCGILELVDIGFPEDAIRSGSGELSLLDAIGIGALMPTRDQDAHKGGCGSVLVVAGSLGMTGAAVLAAEAAMRAGAGRVSVGAPESLHDILETKLTEVMTRPLPEVRRRRCLSRRALGDLLALLPTMDALAIGPGLGRYRETADLVRGVLERDDLPPTVIDADGLFAIGDGNGFFGSRRSTRRSTSPTISRIITPHMGEFARLTGRNREVIAVEPLPYAIEYAQQQGVIVVLKGGPTVVAAPDGRAFVNPTGNAGMATAGSGDVLAGVISGLLAQGCDALTASLCGVFLHGRAGDLARDALGEWGMLAGDLSKQLSEAFVETAGKSRL